MVIKLISSFEKLSSLSHPPTDADANCRLHFLPCEHLHHRTHLLHSCCLHSLHFMLCRPVPAGLRRRVTWHLHLVSDVRLPRHQLGLPCGIYCHQHLHVQCWLLWQRSVLLPMPDVRLPCHQLGLPCGIYRHQHLQVQRWLLWQRSVLLPVSDVRLPRHRLGLPCGICCHQHLHVPSWLL